jgi:hypothetical protein
MKKLFILVGVLIIAASTSIAQELKLDEVLNYYYKATGLDKLQTVKTIIMSGTIIRQDAMPYKLYRVRPNKYRLERDVADITGLTVFDGQIGWSTASWSGNPKPQVIPAQALIDLQNVADFDGIIYDWKIKGHTTELVGKEKIEDSDVYRIKLTRKDGGIEYYLINCNNFLLLRKLSYRIIREKEVEVQNNFSDYRLVDGVMFAFTNVNFMGGQLYSTLQFDLVELNKNIDDNIFVMPTK